jgi:hypothetical protein
MIGLTGPRTQTTINSCLQPDSVTTAPPMLGTRQVDQSHINMPTSANAEESEHYELTF